jgi:PAS domain S-box-containing protein
VEEITGFTAEVLIAGADRFYGIVHPDDLPRVLAHDTDMVGPADPSDLEFRIHHPVKGERWLGHTCRPLFDTHGRFIGRRGTIRDISKRKRAESSLAMAQTVLDRIGDMAFYVSDDGRLVYANDALCRGLGYTREELLRLSVPDLDEDGVAVHWAAFWQRVRDQGNVTLETRMRGKGGRLIPIELAIHYVEFGGRGYHCGFARDVTERRAAQEALRESETRFRAMANTVPDILFTTDSKGLTTYANRRASDYGGVPPESILGLGWLGLVHADDRGRVERHWRRAVRAGGNYSQEMRLRGADGAYRWFVARAHPIRDEVGAIAQWFGACTEIDDLKRAQDQLRDAIDTQETTVRHRTAELQEANAALLSEIIVRQRLEDEVLRVAEIEKRRIGQDLHDDLCQQLAAIAYLCDSVKPDLGPISKRAMNRVRRIGDLLHRALVDARGVARGLSPLHLESRGLRSALRDLASATRGSHGVRCRVTCPETLPRVDLTRATHLFRIVQEAVHNAIRHGRAGTIAIVVSLRRGTVRLTVQDDGRGLPRSVHRREGLGLGSMRYRAQAMGGTFEIRSGRRGGTLVICEAPVPARVSSRAAAARATAAAVARSGARP